MGRTADCGVQTMMSEANKKVSRIGLPIMAILLVALGAYFVGHNAIAQMLRASVEANARSWSNYLVQATPEIGFTPNRTASVAPVEVGPGFFHGLEHAGNIYEYRIYNRFGLAILDSTQLRSGTVQEDSLEVRNQTAIQVIKNGRSNYSFVEKSGNSARSADIAHIYLPLFTSGQTTGAIEILSNETKSWAALQQQFRTVALQVTALILIAFGIPGALYLRRTDELKFATLNLKHTADHDNLTGVLNRSAFTTAMDKKIETCERERGMFAVHFVDLDRFKDVNETMGHDLGDELLKITASRLTNLVGPHDKIARLGADEFAILQPVRSGLTSVTSLADEIAASMAEPFDLDNREVVVGASVGTAIYPVHGVVSSELVRGADIALAHAKSRFPGTAVIFDPEMENQLQARQRIETQLRDALANEGFSIHYQPQYSVDGSNLLGFEALLRMSDADGVPISPAQFIPIAEDIGLIGEIGLWVLRNAIKAALSWSDDIKISVNLSPAQFNTHNMPAIVRQTLKDTGLLPSRLELEVTEGLLIGDTDKVLSELRAIKSLGVSIALDDFGTGYSSLGYLWQFPFDKLKVDKSFMNDLTVEGGKSREILATIIALGRVLDMEVIAEGVETKEQAAVLCDLQCDMIQGYLYGRPMPEEELGAVLIGHLVNQHKNNVSVLKPRRRAHSR